MNPLQELSGKAFDSFRKSCANFVAFRKIDDLPYCDKLQRLAEKFRPQTDSKPDLVFQKLQEEFLEAPARIRKPKNQTLALSIRQPYAEAIMRGTKKIEYRSKLTHVRGRVLIYASKKKVDSEYEAEFLKEHRIAKSVSD